MDWYSALTEHLLGKDNSAPETNGSFESVLQQLEQMVLALYKAILLFQMKSVCSYYKNQGLVFLQTLLIPDKWVNELATVKKAEEDLLKKWKGYDMVKADKVREEALKMTKSMENRLGSIYQDLRKFIDLQQKIRMDNENKELLRDLHVVNPKDDMARIETEKEELFNDAYEWILGTEQYTRFTNLNESDQRPCRLLWIKGNAGMGKTMLLIGIIRELSKQPAVLAPALSYFFCQGQGKSDRPLNNATSTMRSLIWMLLIQQPHLIHYFKTDYETSGKDFFTGPNALAAMCRVFSDMLKDVQPVYFIIDALDECDDGLNKLMELILTSLEKSDNVRWLVSSRPEVDIVSACKNQNICRIIDLNTYDMEVPVKKYIEHKISLLNGNGYTAEILAKVSDEICQRAENTFLWVALVFKTLSSKRGWDALKTIENIPPGLSKLYDHMMTRIEDQDEDDQLRCKNVLVACTLAYRPLSLLELEILAELPSGSPQDIVEKCGSFLTINEATVSPIHQSAQDYLRSDLSGLNQNHKSRLQPRGVGQGHADIVRRSIAAMSGGLKRNIYGLQDYGLESKNITPPDPDPLGPVRYYCMFWLDHLCDAIKADPGNVHQLTDLGFKFLKKHFLHWLESLSLLRKVPDGVFSIRKLMAVVQVLSTPLLRSRY